MPILENFLDGFECMRSCYVIIQVENGNPIECIKIISLCIIPLKSQGAVCKCFFVCEMKR